MKIPERPADFTVKETDTKYKSLVDTTFRAYENKFADGNGSIPSCAGRDCYFYRRGSCNIDFYGKKCVWPYYWMKLDKHGNVLDRDGDIYYTKEQADKIEATLAMNKKQDRFLYDPGSIIVTPDNYTYLVTNWYVYPDNPDEPFSIIRIHKFDFYGCRFATDEEIEKFFKTFNEHGYCYDETKSEVIINKKLSEVEKSSQNSYDETDRFSYSRNDYTTAYKSGAEWLKTKAVEIINSLSEKETDVQILAESIKQELNKLFVV